MSKPIEGRPQPETEIRERAYTDRQLLELAAKAFIAAGYKSGQFDTAEDAAACLCPNGVVWNPLTDDGDALRLAVKLFLMVDVLDTGITDCVHRDYWPEGERHDGDPYAATRRAIVRAAAAIAEGAKS